MDRVETTATVWLGLTLGCARCHDHKYDPFTQKEFYQLYAYFNNVPEKGRAIKYGNSPPLIKAPTTRQRKQIEELQLKLSAVEADFNRMETEIASSQSAWEKALQSLPPLDWSIREDLVAHYALDGNIDSVVGKRDIPERPGYPHPESELRNEKTTKSPAKFVSGTPVYVPGRLKQAVDFDGKRFIDAGNVAPFGFFDKFSFGAWILPRGDKGGTILSRMKNDTDKAGYAVALIDGKIHVNLVVRWLDDALRVETERKLEPDAWHHVLVTYDGSRAASGITVRIDGKLEKLKINLDALYQSFATTEPLLIGSGGDAASRFHGAIDDVTSYHDVLSNEEAMVLAASDAITTIAAVPEAKRTPEQAMKLRYCFLEEHAPDSIRKAWRQILSLRRDRELFEASVPTVMVMQEMDKPRDAFVLIRGQYDKHAEKVAPVVPAVLPPLPAGAPNNRLGLARWLVDPAHPLTPRVMVNRFWQTYFGAGLVRTVEDFGSQGEWPTHPELLDWLAAEFVRNGWNVKEIQRAIVTSATYRQSSKLTPALLQKDPQNRLLARGPRYRLSAEVVRDQALALSGLLVEELGGPSVKPYQPAGLWTELGMGDYRPDKGEKLYRRSLYTYWKRTISPPSLMSFDAAARETCCVRESRTNTPLQALTLMNDIIFVETSRVMAERVLTEGGTTSEQRLAYAFRLATARTPRPEEMKILADALEHHLADYRKNPEAARKLLGIGEHPRNPKLDVAETAAYAAVSGMILNLDETITKE